MVYNVPSNSVLFLFIPRRRCASTLRETREQIKVPAWEEQSAFKELLKVCLTVLFLVARFKDTRHHMVAMEGRSEGREIKRRGEGLAGSQRQRPRPFLSLHRPCFWKTQRVTRSVSLITKKNKNNATDELMLEVNWSQ